MFKDSLFAAHTATLDAGKATLYYDFVDWLANAPPRMSEAEFEEWRSRQKLPPIPPVLGCPF